MKICFVHLGRENLGIEYLSSALKAGGHSVSLAYDPGIFGSEDNVFQNPALERIFSRKDEVIGKILRAKPHITAFSAYTSTYRWCLDIAKAVKSKIDTKIVFGGVHPTLAPAEVMANTFVDYCVAGEGEEAMVELADCIEAGQSCEKIQNVWARSGGKIIINPLREPIRNLDNIIPPDKQLFENEVNIEDDYVIITGRGCLYRCSYCCESFYNEVYNGLYYRRRSPRAVIEELMEMKRRYNFKAVMFNDSVFFNNKIWFKELMSMYARDIKLPFRCFGKANFLDDEVAHTLKYSGCYAVEFGVQTLNEGLKKSLLNRSESREIVDNALKICDKYSLSYDVDHIFGIPGESESDHIKAVEFYSDRKSLNRIKCHFLTFFPELEITKKCADQGYLSDLDVARINSGEAGTFFHKDSVKDEKIRKINKSFAVLFKIMPLLNTAAIEWLLKTKNYVFLRFMPALLVAALQTAAAIKNKDYRYMIYFKYYPLRIKRRFIN